jgi:hypothetical protein
VTRRLLVWALLALTAGTCVAGDFSFRQKVGGLRVLQPGFSLSSEVDFDTVLVGTQAVRIGELVNTGQVPLGPASVASVPGVSLVFSGGCLNLAPGARCQVDFVYEPTVTEDLLRPVVVRINGVEQIVTVLGNGV